MEFINSNKKGILYYLVISDSCANMSNALDIWIKFTSYISPDDLLFIDEIQNKKVASYSEKELDRYYKLKKQIEMSKLLLKYKKQECNEDEYDKVVEFMKTSLREYVRSKVTDEEMISASKFVDNLYNAGTLEEYIDIKQKKYDKLDIYEAYVLFTAKERLYDIRQKELNERILRESKEEYNHLIKKLARDYGNR